MSRMGRERRERQASDGGRKVKVAEGGRRERMSRMGRERRERQGRGRKT